MKRILEEQKAKDLQFFAERFCYIYLIVANPR
jgi:hypothetical protein